MFGAWTTWTPTFVNLSGGTLNYSKYIQIGKTVFFTWKYTLGGAGVGTAVTFTLPVTAHADDAKVSIGGVPHGVARLDDTGTNTTYGIIDFTSTTVARVLASVTSTAYMQTVNLDATAPHVWAATDIIFVKGSYEAA